LNQNANDEKSSLFCYLPEILNESSALDETLALGSCIDLLLLGQKERLNLQEIVNKMFAAIT